jgi:hypothetical protein
MVVEKFRNIAHKTEEVTDIIDRMPRDTPRLVRICNPHRTTPGFVIPT